MTRTTERFYAIQYKVTGWRTVSKTRNRKIAQRRVREYESSNGFDGVARPGLYRAVRQIVITETLEILPRLKSKTS